MAEKEGSKWKKITIIGVGVAVLLMFLVFLFVGFSGVLQFFKFLLYGSIIIGLIFGLFYIFYVVFIKKEYKDIPANFKKKLRATSLIMKNDMLGDLYLSGDTHHNRIKLGKYRYLRLNLPKQNRKMEKGEDGKPVLDEYKQPVYSEETQGVPIDCFIIQNNKNILDSLFSEPQFILVKPEDHNYSAIFNDVTINGFNLVPLDSQFFTIDHRNLDVDLAKGMTTNYMKEVVYEIFADLDKLVKLSMNLDADHEKEKSKNNEFQIPQFPFGGQPPQK